MPKIFNMTGCLKPCKYTEYSIGIQLYEESEDVTNVIISADPIISVKKEILVYPFTSLVAEVGGALGLFLGFSFLMLWDVLEILKVKVGTRKWFKLNTFA